MNPLLELLGGVGYVLDTPGALLRGGLSGRLGERASGREMLESWGMLDPNQEGFDAGDVAGFAADMVVDPLNLISGAGIAKYGPKAASSLGRLLGMFGGHADDAARVAAEVAPDVIGKAPSMLDNALAGHADDWADVPIGGQGGPVEWAEQAAAHVVPPPAAPLGEALTDAGNLSFGAQERFNQAWQRLRNIENSGVRDDFALGQAQRAFDDAKHALDEARLAHQKAYEAAGGYIDPLDLDKFRDKTIGGIPDDVNIGSGGWYVQEKRSIPSRIEGWLSWPDLPPQAEAASTIKKYGGSVDHDEWFGKDLIDMDLMETPPPGSSIGLKDWHEMLNEAAKYKWNPVRINDSMIRQAIFKGVPMASIAGLLGMYGASQQEQ